MDFRTVLTVGQSSQSTLHMSDIFFIKPAGLVAPTAPISTRPRYVLRIAGVKVGELKFLASYIYNMSKKTVKVKLFDDFFYFNSQ